MTHRIYWGLGVLIVLLVGAFSYLIYQEYADIEEIKEDGKAFRDKIAKMDEQRETQEQQSDGTTLVDTTGTTPVDTATTDTAKTSKTVTIATPEQDNTEEVKVSPFGFGSYPKVPDDYPGDFGRQGEINWAYRDSPGKELISRVLVKLWAEGERNFIGGSTHRGKVYPHYYDTVYVRIEETETGRSIRRKSGPFVDFSLDDLDDPPPHIRILDLETSGIDPYQYLNLPK